MVISTAVNNLLVKRSARTALTVLMTESAHTVLFSTFITMINKIDLVLVSIIIWYNFCYQK